jgi:TetR/AcrR family tetracycline transcriptional repressor
MVQPAKLSREKIVREAIALLQEGGLEALTLRRLAERLHARAPSLARHVGDKGELTALVSAAIFLDALASIPQGLTGPDWLRAYGHALRAKQRETRDVTALIAAAPPHEESEHMVSERLQAALAGAGLAGDKGMLRQSAVQAFVTGWTVFEASRRKGFLARLPQQDAFAQGLDALVAGFGSPNRPWSLRERPTGLARPWLPDGRSDE